jgi:Transposase DDE domain group 1
VSLVYPGNQTSQACLRPTVAAAERVLGLTPAQRRRTVLRLDGGFGTDANLNWALWHGYQVLAKGYSGKRANAYARAVRRWEELRPGERWIAPAPTPLHYYRRTQTAVLKWKTGQGKYGHSLLTTSLREHSLRELAERYDDRAAIEAEFKADKGGLQLHRRRKQRLAAQEALVLLTDLAHNLLAWTRGWLFRNSPFAEAGIYRIVKELFPIPGKVRVEEGQIVKLRLKASHPVAIPMLACLKRVLDLF